jgi:hypothetical protein
LSAWIDRTALIAAIKATREEPKTGVALALVDLFAFAEWVASVEVLSRT